MKNSTRALASETLASQQQARKQWLIRGLFSAFAFFFLLGASSDQPDFSGWLNGAEGMYEASRLYDERAQPIFVYFYTDWCGYCRQFERELLSSSQVDEYLDDIVAVRINPESGPVEAAIGQRYRVNGFPALFVHSSESKTISRVERMEIIDGRPSLKSPGAFIDVLKQAGAR